MRSHYQVLGVKRTASFTEIKTAYRRKANKLHPDHGGDPSKFREIAAAYQTLSDPAKRKLYDAPRAKPAPAPKPFNPHPGSPPLTPSERDRMVEGLRAVGLHLFFDFAIEFTPPGRARDILRQTRKQMDAEAAEFLKSLRGSR